MDRNEQRWTSLQPQEWIKGKMIGSGSFGTVHLAMRKDTGALFVIKSCQGKASIEALENEANILESLNSPYVVGCLGRNILRAGKNGGKKLCIFMEYMAGGNLSDVADKFGGKLDEEIVRLYTREILFGLKCLHRNRIVHCDLKCKNVLLGSDGSIKLADFGCAKRLDDLKSHGASRISSGGACVAGTPLWMAPEILRNRDFDTSADIWSLGCTVIEMATGRPPWRDNNVSSPEAALMKIGNSNELPTFPKGFSVEGIDFLTKCFQRDARRRSTAEELLMHPFILGNSMSDSKKENVDSPSSVLMFELDMEDSDVEQELECNHDYELPHKNPFSAKCHQEQEGETTVKRKQTDNDLSSSEGWVNVRCGCKM